MLAINLNELFDINLGAVEISTDSRSIQAGEFFLPIVGENFDGHKFIPEVLEKGAAGAFSAQAEYCKDPRVIKVDDTLATYHQIAKHYLKEINPKVVAITGSSGKTTTKEMMHLVLSQKYKVHYSHANFNNEIGVPKTILEMPRDCDLLVLEMGMRGLKEIELLSNTGEPDYAVITNIGTAHIERLGSIEKIREAKLEITSGLKTDGVLFIDSKLADSLSQESLLKGGILKYLGKQITTKVFDYQSNYNISGLAGEEIHADANAVALVAEELGITDTQTGLDLYNPGQGRGSFHYDQNGNLFIDDSYNANPDSSLASARALINQFKDKKKIMVLGEILESDEKLIDDLFTQLKSEQDLELIDARDKDIDSVVTELKALINGSNDHAILIKASRKAKLERVLEQFKVL